MDEFDTYLSLRQQMQDLEEAMERMKPSLLATIRSQGGVVTRGDHDFVLGRATSWAFSSEVKRLQEALSIRKRAEKKDGTAMTRGETEYVMIRRHRPPEGAKRKEKAYTLDEVRRETPRAYERWDAEEENYLRAAFTEGQTVEDLAASLQRKPGGIRSRLVKLGLLEE